MPESQGQNLALAALYVRHLLSSEPSVPPACQSGERVRWVILLQSSCNQCSTLKRVSGTKIKALCCQNKNTFKALQFHLLTGEPHDQENAPPLGPYRRPMPRVLGGSYGGGQFLMAEVPLYDESLWRARLDSPGLNDTGVPRS